MTLKTRMMIVTLVGLAITMAFWGWMQLSVLDEILKEQQYKRLNGIADTLSTFYQRFPTRRGLSALDTALKDHISTDLRLARIDIISRSRDDIDYIAGAGRVAYEWPENLINETAEKRVKHHYTLQTEAGSALGLLYPVPSEKGHASQTMIGVILFSQSNTEILARARWMLFFSTLGLLAVILLLMATSYGFLIGRPLSRIIETIDDFRTGKQAKRIPIDSLDEWGQLADHFNVMADEIEKFIGQNQELTRGLELRVKEATLKVVQLQSQVNQLQQLNALGYLTATLAHDLGTPLHSVAGMTQLLLEREDWPPDVARKLEVILQQTQRLNSVIQNVRRATRLPEPHFESLTVKTLLDDTLPLVEPMIAKSKVELVVQIAPDIPALHVDPYRVQTALFNLIQNALEAMPNGGKMTLSARVAPERQAISLTVLDTGTGIPPEMMKKIYEPFFSTHSSEGIRGLGMAIVQDIVKTHAGSIDIESSPEKGTSITLYFPLVAKAN
ncbi:HAMP domain-containing protein [Syntrophus gentianae]|uniref:histidine kinase n=1 Tax=Syntrophus gentianae TaxID=43775 RepID=A0A1H7UGY1_9BACT|nr:ATP-binding protein [Syntrophus gentianae]SEL96005.1 HAMP domain-containing protein [Syntrophus gentianae]